MRNPRNLLAAWELKPKKALGQNFLNAPEVVDRILSAAAVGPAETVLEIGPGLGALTLPLAGQTSRLIAVEKDPEMLRLLRAELLAAGHDHVRVIDGSILTLDISGLARSEAPLAVLGNLPYNISSQVLVRLVENRACIDRAVLMFQKELVERIVAAPGSRDYGRLTVLLAYCAEVRHLFAVGAERFFPRPKVDSAVVHIRFKPPEAPVRDEVLFSRVVVIDAMIRMDPEAVIREGLSNDNACCCGAAAAAIAAGKMLGARQAEELAYATSYDRSPGDSFVGYVGMVF